MGIGERRIDSKGRDGVRDRDGVSEHGKEEASQEEGSAGVRETGKGE